MPENDTLSTVPISLDGREVQASPGQLLIAAAEEAGVYIPRFCWHPRLRPVAMCRMCLVEVEGMRGLQPACYVPVKEGMEVRTQTPLVKKVQEGVLEFLLLNHPLDCPVCDRGGECPLQDHTMSFGPGESRFVEEKRHFEKPVPINNLVLLDRERCIQCARCTRFASDVAGDPLLEFASRGNDLQVTVFPDEPFSSYFSGNVVQICPVGALTSIPYRFKARPWDVTIAETTCGGCAVGCRGALSETRNRLIRFLGVDNDAVSWGWLCDKGRFAYEYVGSENRLTVPLFREETAAADAFSEVSWAEAVERIAEQIQEVKGAGGNIAAIGGARLTNEEAYSLSKFMRVVCGTNDVDCQLDDGLPADFVAGARNRAVINDFAKASVIVLAGPDLKEELPVLYLRVRDAVVNQGVPLFVIGPPQSGLTDFAKKVFDTPAAFDPVLLPIAGDVVLIVGRQSAAQDAEAQSTWALGLSEQLGERVKLLPILRRSNVHGAIDMGLSPSLLPGRVTVDDLEARERLAQVWEGEFPPDPGRDCREILDAAVEGKIDILFVVGADPLTDFPDPVMARRALERTSFVVVLDLFPSSATRFADVVLPAAGWGEVSGTVTNLEGRVQRVAAKVTAPGQAASDAQVFREIAEHLEVDFGCGTPEATLREIAQVAPAYQGVSLSRFRGKKGKEGVLVGEGRVAPRTSSPFEKDARPLGNGFRLHVGRAFWDRGTLVSECPSLSGLRPGPIVRVHPEDLAFAGITDGSSVRVLDEDPAGRLDLLRTVVADERVPLGTVSVPHNQDEPFVIRVGATVTLERID